FSLMRTTFFFLGEKFNNFNYSLIGTMLCCPHSLTVSSVMFLFPSIENLLLFEEGNRTQEDMVLLLRHFEIITQQLRIFFF
ncbi:hypothetical protein L9F63_001812, partial [Diploptera punctata]